MARARWALAAASCIVTVIVGAPMATADPQDLVPWCSGDQTPMDTNCRVAPTQEFTDAAPGANPDVPLGVNPGQVPAT
ncbi:MAG: hypothetical protein HYZ38_26985 [Mycobacterium sp.]|jgi:hypothetical protein|nr:hypothetical protein [Mycobacterium sp.]